MDLRGAAASPLQDEGFFVVEVERFQGPLDLLLHLIRHQDIDILDIPISRITDQFLAVIREIDAENLDNAGEFLEMAATLVRIKAQMLLPRYEEEESEDPRAELVRRLLEYEQVREITTRLAASEAERARRFGKGFVPSRPQPLAEETPLETTWDDVLEAALEIRLPELRQEEHRLRLRSVPVEEKIDLILQALSRVTRVEFSKLINPWKERIHGVMTFLAGLELSRRRHVRLRQVSPFAELWIYRRDDADGLEEDGEAPQESDFGSAPEGRRPFERETG